jgi:pyridoxamine 5'-phosphate oxidase
MAIAMTDHPANMRHDYRLGHLTEADAAADPFSQFRFWFAEAVAANVPEVNAMTLASVDSGGQPSARIVLLKGFDDQGFVFFTNYLSRKGQELSANPKASLLFFWPGLERQVRIDGTVSMTSRSESETYFHTRPLASQISALASKQSRVIPSRAALEQLAADLTQSLAGKPIPLPDYWGGYRLDPSAIEFWQGRESRLHDRLLYIRTDSKGWKIERLSP